MAYGYGIGEHPAAVAHHWRQSERWQVRGLDVQLTVRLFGVELLFVDLTDEQACEPDEALDYTTYPVGFVSPPAVPYEIDCPERE